MDQDSDLITHPYTRNKLLRGVKTQLRFRSPNSMFKAHNRTYLPKLSFQESTLHSLLSLSEGRTISEPAVIMGMSNTELYYLLASLQDKKLVKSITSRPVNFIGIKGGIW